MLRGIPRLLTPELLKVLCEMGHGDTLVLADGNFPRNAYGEHARIVRMDGLGIPELLRSILPFFPLDSYVEKPLTLMQLVPGDPVKTPIWNVYEGLAEQYDPRGKLAIGHLDRCTFYEKARRAYAVLATGETALYANLILQKGVVQNGPEAAGD